MANEPVLVLEDAAVAVCPNGVCDVPVVHGSNALQLIVRNELPIGLPHRPRGPDRSVEEAALRVLSLTQQKGATP